MYWGSFGVIRPVGLVPSYGYITGTISPSNVAFNFFGMAGKEQKRRGVAGCLADRRTGYPWEKDCHKKAE
jgi:hypothetical protein